KPLESLRIAKRSRSPNPNPPSPVSSPPPSPPRRRAPCTTTAASPPLLPLRLPPLTLPDLRRRRHRYQQAPSPGDPDLARGRSLEWERGHSAMPRRALPRSLLPRRVTACSQPPPLLALRPRICQRGARRGRQRRFSAGAWLRVGARDPGYPSAAQELGRCGQHLQDLLLGRPQTPPLLLLYPAPCPEVQEGHHPRSLLHNGECYRFQKLNNLDLMALQLLRSDH
ncbi:unnamed protein product, partial [Urochloa humidicola]